LSGRLSFADYFEQMASRDELTCLTVDTTGACDLTCAGMCYYHPEIPLRRREVPFESLASAIEEAGRLLHLKTLVIAGKEPLLNPRRLFAILEDAGSRRSRNYLVGVITNGRHIHRHWDHLEQAARSGWIDFLDVSIDSGFPEQHDAIRGASGTYDLASAAVRAAATSLHAVRTSICSILRPDNPAGILELLRKQSDVIQCFWIFPVQPPPFSAMPPLAGRFVSSFLRSLLTILAEELRDREMQVMVPLQGLYLSRLSRKACSTGVTCGRMRSALATPPSRLGRALSSSNAVCCPNRRGNWQESHTPVTTWRSCISCKAVIRASMPLVTSRMSRFKNSTRGLKRRAACSIVSAWRGRHTSADSGHAGRTASVAGRLRSKVCSTELRFTRNRAYAQSPALTWSR